MLSRAVSTARKGARAFSAGEFYPGIGNIKYEGPDSKNPLAFKHYNADEVIMGKTMREHCRFSVVCKSAAAAACPQLVDGSAKRTVATIVAHIPPFRNNLF